MGQIHRPQRQTVPGAVGTYNAVAHHILVNGGEVSLPDIEPGESVTIATSFDVAEASRSFWSTQPSSQFGSFMSPELRDEIADAQETILIVDVHLQGTVNDDCWMTEVEHRGQRWTIPFGYADFRNDQMEAVKQAIHEYGPIEATLVSFDAKGGHGWKLAEPVTGYLPAPGVPF